MDDYYAQGPIWPCVPNYSVDQPNSYFNRHGKNVQLSHHSQSRDHYYNLENIPRLKNFACEICNKSFFTHGQYKKHVDGHVECPFPDCNLKADMKIINQHIDHQHMLINFEALQIDDETWIAERKKRYPTVQRAELRRAEQIERLKRGEKLGKDKKKFAVNVSNRKGNRPTRNSKQESSNENRQRKEFSYVKTPKRPRTPILLDDPYDSDSDNKLGVPAFRGTKAFFESTGEVSLFGLKQSESSVDRQSDIDISDEEDWSNPTNGTVEDKTTLQNALGVLMGAYESGSDSDSGLMQVEPSNNLCEAMTDAKKVPDISIEVGKVSDFNICKENKSFSSTENCNRRRRKHHSKSHWKRRNGEAEKSVANQKYKLNIHKFHKVKGRRRPTLLQKLLEPNIVHERNVILQCIRHIVVNNYFEVVSNNQSNEPCMEN